MAPSREVITKRETKEISRTSLQRTARRRSRSFVNMLKKARSARSEQINAHTGIAARISMQEGSTFSVEPVRTQELKGRMSNGKPPLVFDRAPWFV